MLLLAFQVFKKFGVEKIDPTNEEFDPNKHNAVFQVPDPEKAPGMIAVCLKVLFSIFFSITSNLIVLLHSPEATL